MRSRQILDVTTAFFVTILWPTPALLAALLGYQFSGVIEVKQNGGIGYEQYDGQPFTGQLFFDAHTSNYSSDWQPNPKSGEYWILPPLAWLEIQIGEKIFVSSVEYYATVDVRNDDTLRFDPPGVPSISGDGLTFGFHSVDTRTDGEISVRQDHLITFEAIDQTGLTLADDSLYLPASLDSFDQFAIRIVPIIPRSSGDPPIIIPEVWGHVDEIRPIPEPETLILTLIALVVIGFMGLRRYQSFRRPILPGR